MSILTQLSPGIQVNEIDLTAIVPAVSTSVGAFVGQFNWGPCDLPTLISDETEMVSMFGKPTAATTDSFAGQCFFSCASFLAYTNSLYITRTVNGANNASDAVAANANVSVTAFTIKNITEYEENYQYNSNTQGAVFIAKYPGSIGNSIKVSMYSNAGANSSAFNNWRYASIFDNAPGTSNYIFEKRYTATSNTSFAATANDELHIVVIDEKGQFTGRANTVLEKFSFLSKATDSIDINGKSNFYKEYIKNYSQYIYTLDTPTGANNWGTLSADTTVYDAGANNGIYECSLSNGTNGSIPTDGQLQSNWALFKNKDQYEISLAFMGSSSVPVSKYVLDNVILGYESETPTLGRKDTIMFVSPRYQDVVNKPGQEIANIVTNTNSFLNALERSSSYLVCDSGWKRMLDRYNNVYRWIPLNADMAGLCAYTDAVADPWYSPGGYNRGKMKNVLNLAWSPTQTDRDILYKNGINPVISQRGEGIILLGDKTMQFKPSAFDRINVRRLFIVLEKAIATASKFQLFEFNDAFTRAQFRNLVEPYLRDVQGRRGITDFRVVCDETNNTAEVIDRNEFVADIYVKPARSINFVQLNFIATRSGISFEELGA